MYLKFADKRDSSAFWKLGVIFAISLVLPGLSAAQVTLSIPSDVAFVSPGDELIVPIGISDGSGIVSYRVQINFPATQLAFDRAENGGLSSGWGAPIANPGRTGPRRSQTVRSMRTRAGSNPA